MTFKLALRVAETTTTTGTGSLSLGGAKAGFRAFSDEYAIDDSFYYLVKDTNGNWEVGLGRLSGATTLARSFVIESSNSDALVSFAAGTKDVSVVALGLPGADYGDGSDGDFTASSGTTTFTRDMYYRRFTPTSSAVVDTAGFKLYCSEIFDIGGLTTGFVGRAQVNGSASVTTTGAAGGTAGASGTLGGGGSNGGTGGSGTTGNGNNGNGSGAASNSLGGQTSGASGAGGNNSGGAQVGGSGVAGTSRTLRQFNRRVDELYYIPNAALVTGGAGGSGGGAGAGDGTNSGRGGGGGGAGGAGVFIAARVVRRTASTTSGCIRAPGGKGGTGSTSSTGNAGGGGGGGGGAGGFVYIKCDVLIGAAKTGCVNVAGGAGGNGGAAIAAGRGGTGGNGGYGGRFLLFVGPDGTEQVGSVGGTGTSTGTNTAGSGGSAGAGSFDL